MKNTDFAYAVATVRAREVKLLTPSFMEQLIFAGTYENAKQLLIDEGFKGFEATDDASEALKSCMQETYDFLCEISPSSSVFDFLAVKNDFHNLKAVLKAAVLNNENAEKYFIYPAVLSWSGLSEIILDKRFDELPKLIREPASKGYELLTSTLDGQLLDVFIDKCSLEAMERLAQESGCEFAEKYAQEYAAVSDIKAALRASQAEKSGDFIESVLCENELIDISELKAAASKGVDEVIDFLEGTSFASLAKEYLVSNTAFEKACDDRLTKLLEDSRFISLGPEPLISYYCAMDTQIKTLRIIMSCKKILVSPERIVERMRALNV